MEFRTILQANLDDNDREQDLSTIYIDLYRDIKKIVLKSELIVI